MTRCWRGAEYHITVHNPEGVEKGVVSVVCDGKVCDGRIPVMESGTVHEVVVTMGRE